jgi:hypothetical protein
MRMQFITEDVGLEKDAGALRDYVYSEAETAGQKLSATYAPPLTSEDRKKALQSYASSSSFLTWWDRAVNKKVLQLINQSGKDVRHLFEAGGPFSLRTALKDGFYAGFGA